MHQLSRSQSLLFLFLTFYIESDVPYWLYNTHNLKGYKEEKLNKYELHAEKIQQVWHQREVCVLTLILDTAGVVPRSLLESLAKL